MNKREIFKKIGGIISEITEQYQYLSENLDNLNNLELELFVANSHFLSDHIQILKKLNDTELPLLNRTNSNIFPPSQEPIKIFEPVSEEQNKPEELEVKLLEKNNEDEVKEEIIAFESTQHPESLVEKFESKPSAQATEVQQPEVSRVASQAMKIDEAEDLQEKLKDNLAVRIEESKQNVIIRETFIPKADPILPVPTINDLISAQRKPNSGGQINRTPIADLKTNINLNDKLLFIKDLFNGYSLAYSEAIELLNRFDSFEAADKFLTTNYSEKNNWASKQSTASKFYEILQRRFIK